MYMYRDDADSKFRHIYMYMYNTHAYVQAVQDLHFLSFGTAHLISCRYTCTVNKDKNVLSGWLLNCVDLMCWEWSHSSPGSLVHRENTSLAGMESAVCLQHDIHVHVAEKAGMAENCLPLLAKWFHVLATDSGPN